MAAALLTIVLSDSAGRCVSALPIHEVAKSAISGLFTRPRQSPQKQPLLFASCAGCENGHMLVARIDHVQLAMPAVGEGRARKFYRDVLGLPEVPKPPHLGKRGGCWFERAELKIPLGVDPDFRPAQKAHPALVIDGLNTLIAILESEGYPVQPDAPMDGHRRVYVDDPFGNRIELIEAG